MSNVVAAMATHAKSEVTFLIRHQRLSRIILSSRGSVSLGSWSQELRMALWHTYNSITKGGDARGPDDGVELVGYYCMRRVVTY